MKISIVIPVYNSQESLSDIMNEIDTYFSKRSYEFEIIFINDKSTDASYEVLKEISLKSKRKNIKLIDLQNNYGQQNAIFCGLHYARGDYIVTMDDDLQHNIDDLDGMIDEMKTGKDLVYGVYDINNKAYRNIGSKLTRLFFVSNFKSIRHQRVSSFRIFTKELLEVTLLCPYKFIYLSGIMLNNTKKVGNVKVVQRKRLYGTSGYNLKKLLVLFFNLNRYYSKYSLECMKAKCGAFEIKEVIDLEQED